MPGKVCRVAVESRCNKPLASSRRCELTLEHLDLSRLVVFDLPKLAAEPGEIPRREMPGDFYPGRDAYPLNLLVLPALTRPGGEQVVPMVFLIAVCRYVGHLAHFIHTQHHRGRHPKR